MLSDMLPLCMCVVLCILQVERVELLADELYELDVQHMSDDDK
jgi:hypothetical protein